MKFVKNFNFYFFIFILSIILLAIFYLYQKHLIGNDSTISEWIINYQGGFTRRGLLGEICFKIANYFELSLRFVIFLFQSTFYFIYMLLVYSYVKSLPKNVLTIIAIYSPIFLLYPIAEIEVLARKEIFLFISFIIFLKLSGLNIPKNFSLIYIFFIFPVILLIWEPFVFLFPFAIYVILLQHRDDSFKRIILKIFLTFSTSIATFIYIIFNLLTPEGHEIMANSLMNNFGEVCYMSCGLLKSKSSIKSQFDGVLINLSLIVFIRYFFIMLIGFFPLLILYYNSRIKEKIFFFNKIDNLFLVILILLSPTLILFSAATDWGRWVNITYTFSVLLYFFLIKNNYLYTNSNLLFFDNFYNNKKVLFFIIFIIFAFGWNQKTAMTGDIGTNTGYKILYNTSKRIFNFGGIRLFQNNPIIKLHKKYIE